MAGTRKRKDVPERKTARSAGSNPEELDELREEVAGLRRETAALREQVASTTPSASGWRRAVAVLLIVIGCLLAAAAVPAVWLNRTVADTDAWVATMAPLSRNPAIQTTVADYASDEILKQVDVRKLAADALPPQAQFLAQPIAAQVRTFVRVQAYNVVHSKQFSEIWASVNRRAHEAVLALITGKQGEVLSLREGRVTLDLSRLVAEIKSRLQRTGLGSIGANVLGDAGGQYTLFYSPALATASRAFELMNTLALVLPLAALLALAVGVWASPDRRRALLRTGIGLVLVMGLSLAAVYFARYPYTDAVERLGSIPSDAALAVYDIVLAGLLAAQRTILVAGLLIAVGAALAGPSPFAVHLRGGVQSALQAIGPGWDFGSFGVWVRDRRSMLRGLGLVVGSLALVVWSSPGVAGVLWAAFAVLVYIILVEFFGREPSPQPMKKSEEAQLRPGVPRKKHVA